MRTLFLKDSFINDLDLAAYSHDRYQTSLNQAPHLSDETETERKRYNIAYLNIKWFMQTLLDRMDRTSMYSGLEARVPFADHRIIEYVFNVPWEMKYQNGVEKALLRDACKDLLPGGTSAPEKSPYPKTYHPGYEKLLIAEMQHILDQPDAPVKTFIDTKTRNLPRGTDRIRKAVVRTAHGRTAAARLLHPDQLLDAEIPPESVISGWVEAQSRLSGLAVCRIFITYDDGKEAGRRMKLVQIAYLSMFPF